jgi:hypothetical protein
MGRLHIGTRSASDWRDRLGAPERHWKRGFSAMETAVSWECAGRVESGLPEAVEKVFSESEFGIPKLLLAIAEHKVRLDGKGAAAQCDVWALIKTGAGTVSLAVEAKADEPFGAGNEALAKWLKSGKSELNRHARWAHLKEHLPVAADRV